MLPTKNCNKTFNQGVLISTSELTSTFLKHEGVEQLRKHGTVEVVTKDCSLALTAQWGHQQITSGTANTHIPTHHCFSTIPATIERAPNTPNTIPGPFKVDFIVKRVVKST